jgi:hypothetical protein
MLSKYISWLFLCHDEALSDVLLKVKLLVGHMGENLNGTGRLGR